MIVYLDTCIISRIIDLDFTDDVAHALEKLSDSDHELITSPKTLSEMDLTRDGKKRSALKLLYKVFGGKVPLQSTTVYYSGQFGDAPWGTTLFGGGGSGENVLLQLLRQTFKNDDAEHIFQAIKSGADYFLTLDDTTILKRARANYNNVNNFCKSMKFVNPIELVRDLAI